MARCMKCGTEIKNDEVLCRDCLREKARILNRAFSQSMNPVEAETTEANDSDDDEK